VSDLCEALGILSKPRTTESPVGEDEDESRTILVRGKRTPPGTACDGGGRNCAERPGFKPKTKATSDQGRTSSPTSRISRSNPNSSLRSNDGGGLGRDEGPGALWAGEKWYDKKVTQQIDIELVKKNLRDIQRQRLSINQKLDPEQEYNEKDFSDLLIEQYGIAVKSFNDFILNGLMTPERLEEEYKTFHATLGYGLVYSAGDYGIEINSRTAEIEKLFKHIFSDEFEDAVEDDPISAAASVFVELVNLQPFYDGNKRAASFILNYVLMKCGYTPFILTSSNIIEYTKILRPRGDYVRVNVQEFEEFLRGQVKRTPGRGPTYGYIFGFLLPIAFSVHYILLIVGIGLAILALITAGIALFRWHIKKKALDIIRRELELYGALREEKQQLRGLSLRRQPEKLGPQIAEIKQCLAHCLKQLRRDLARRELIERGRHPIISTSMRRAAGHYRRLGEFEVAEGFDQLADELEVHEQRLRKKAEAARPPIGNRQYRVTDSHGNSFDSRIVVAWRDARGQRHSNINLRQLPHWVKIQIRIHEGQPNEQVAIEAQAVRFRQDRKIHFSAPAKHKSWAAWVRAIGGAAAIVKVLGKNYRDSALLWLRGVAFPRLRVIERIAKRLDIDVRELIRLRYRKATKPIRQPTPLAARFASTRTKHLGISQELHTAVSEVLTIFEAQVIRQAKDESIMTRCAIEDYRQTLSALGRRGYLYHSELFAESTAFLLPEDNLLTYGECFGLGAFVNRGNPSCYVLVVFVANEKDAKRDKLIVVGFRSDVAVLGLPKSRILSLEHFKGRSQFFLNFFWQAKEDYFRDCQVRDAFVQKYFRKNKRLTGRYMALQNARLKFPSSYAKQRREKMWEPLGDRLRVVSPKKHIHAGQVWAIVHVWRDKKGRIQPFRTPDGRMDYLFFVPLKDKNLVYSSLQKDITPLVTLGASGKTYYAFCIPEILTFFLTLLSRYGKWRAYALASNVESERKSPPAHLHLSTGYLHRRTNFYLGSDFHGAVAYLTNRGHSAKSCGVPVVRIYSASGEQVSDVGSFLDRKGKIIRSEVYVDAQARWVNQKGEPLNIEPLELVTEISLLDNEYFVLSAVSSRDSVPCFKCPYIHLPLFQYLVSHPEERPYGLDLKVTPELESLGEPASLTVGVTHTPVREIRSQLEYHVYPTGEPRRFFNLDTLTWQLCPVTEIRTERQRMRSKANQLVLHKKEKP
jgi:hypothetical protein